MPKRPLIVFTAARWFVLATLVVATIAIYTLRLYFTKPEPPPPPKPPEVIKDCQDSVFYESRGSEVRCDSRSRIEVWPSDQGFVLVKCLCRRDGK